MKVSVVQMNSSAVKEDNLKQAEHLVREAVAADTPDLVALPEMFACLSAEPEILQASAEVIDESTTISSFSALAKELQTSIHIGSMIEREGEQFYNTSVALDASGKVVARYRKMHLFDITLPDGTEANESASLGRGKEVVTYNTNDITVGCAICYDLRFPELFRKLRDLDSQLIMTPAAFTFQTGSAHWDLLVRNRAIETQCYVAAPAQIFSFDEGRHSTWGHAMIVDPWGQVVAQVPNKIGWATATLDMDWLQQVRARLPLRNHHVLN